MRGARKKVVFLAGLGVAAVLALAGLQWKELAIRYHLQRMRGAPAYWLEGMEKPDGTPQKEASSRFLESDGAFLRVLEGLGVDESKSPRRPPVIAAPPVLRVLFGKPRDPRKAPAFRALGELGLKAQPGKSVSIVRQLMQGLEEEEKKNSNPLDAGDSRILTGLRLVDSIQEEALGALVKIALKAEETLPLYAGALKSKSRTLQHAASIVLGNRDAGKKLIAQALSGIPPENAVNFFRTILATPEQSQLLALSLFLAKNFGPPDRSRALEIAAAIAWIESLGLNADDRVTVLDIKAGELLRIQFEKPNTMPWAGACGARLSISTNGTRLACVAQSAKGDGEIFLLDFDAETAINVSQSPAEDSKPCLAQGGRLVLFSSDRDRAGSLYLADTRTRTLTRVVPRHGEGCDPWITEDGSQVFFAFEGALWRKDLKSQSETKLISSETENVYHASISGDGKRALIEWIQRETRRTRTTFHELGAVEETVAFRVSTSIVAFSSRFTLRIFFSARGAAMRTFGLRGPSSCKISNRISAQPLILFQTDFIVVRA